MLCVHGCCDPQDFVRHWRLPESLGTAAGREGLLAVAGIEAIAAGIEALALGIEAIALGIEAIVARR